MKKVAIWIGIIVGLMLVGVPVQAAEADEHIRSFDSQVTISRDNVAHIKETIIYDFGTSSHHGIYRDIPIDYKDGDKNFYLSAKYSKTVDEGGNEVTAEVSEVSGNERLKLGDADKTLTGTHTYVITYTLSPIIIQKDNKPFLLLDLLGEGWQVPVDHFSASVKLEGGSQLSDIKWYDASGDLPAVTKENIPPYTGVTINAFLPEGYVSSYLEPNKPRPVDVWKFIVALGIIIPIALTSIVAILILILRSSRARAKRKAQTVIPEYEPPKNMSPAAMGLLEDDAAEMREITATVIDWAVRGFIRITREEKKGLFGSVSYTLTQLKSSASLDSTEKALYEAFFSNGKEVSLKDLDTSKMAAAATEFKSAIKSQLTDAGYYAKNGGVLEKGNLTDAGAQQWAKVDGFKLYLGVVEKDRLNFSDAPEKTPERFNALLPYAVALGVEKEWAKQFEGIDITSATTWYTGNLAAFSAVNLANDIGTSFASTVSSNSSVSTSGGSSGGGFGGGGGGSW